MTILLIILGLLLARVVIDAHKRRGWLAKFAICFALSWALLFLLLD